METMNTDTPETDTPESDKAKIAFTSLFASDDAYWVPFIVARKLERERDEWRQHGHREADMRLQLMGERDDARLKVERERDALIGQLREEQRLHVQTLNERDEARQWESQALVARIQRDQFSKTLGEVREILCAALPNGNQLTSFMAVKLVKEREEARNEIIGWRNKWDCAIDMAARAENALDEMTLRWERTNDALFAERALTDRLAGIIREWRDGYGGQMVDPECGCCDCKWLKPIDEALAAWKEARSYKTRKFSPQNAHVEGPAISATPQTEKGN